MKTSTKRKPKTTTDAMEILNQIANWTPEDRRVCAQIKLEMELGQIAYDLRALSGLTQKQLAVKTRLKADEIKDVEDADFEGNTIRVIARIAHELGKTIKLQIEPLSTREIKKIRKATHVG